MGNEWDADEKEEEVDFPSKKPKGEEEDLDEGVDEDPTDTDDAREDGFAADSDEEEGSSGLGENFLG